MFTIKVSNSYISNFNIFNMNSLFGIFGGYTNANTNTQAFDDKKLDDHAQLLTNLLLFLNFKINPNPKINVQITSHLDLLMFFLLDGEQYFVVNKDFLSECETEYFKHVYKTIIKRLLFNKEMVYYEPKHCTTQYYPEIIPKLISKSIDYYLLSRSDQYYLDCRFKIVHHDNSLRTLLKVSNVDIVNFIKKIISQNDQTLLNNVDTFNTFAQTQCDHKLILKIIQHLKNQYEVLITIFEQFNEYTQNLEKIQLITDSKNQIYENLIDKLINYELNINDKLELIKEYEVFEELKNNEICEISQKNKLIECELNKSELFKSDKKILLISEEQKEIFIHNYQVFIDATKHFINV